MILLVDDQKYNLEALLIILEYHVELNPKICRTAFDGNQALDAVIQNVKTNNNEKCDFRLILMDVNMPFMDGLEATSKIRSFLTQMNIDQPFIVACTGNSDQKTS